MAGPMSDLVVYYSLSGKSKLVADWLAETLQADTDAIVETEPRDFEARGIFAACSIPTSGASRRSGR